MPESRKYTEAQKKSAKKWDAANLDRLSIAVPKGKKDDIKAVAAAAGESMNQYIINAVDQRMARDGARGPQEPAEAPLTAFLAQAEPGETVSQFVERAVDGQAQRDEAARKLVGKE